MKLYLSSFRLGDDIAELRSMVGDDIKFALVPNALDGIEDAAARQSVIDRGVSDLVSEGFHVTTFDLRDYFESPEFLANALKGFNRLFITGGNVFVLRRAMSYSGLDEYIQQRKTDSNFIYASYSAGSCICGPTLKGIDLVDDPDLVPERYRPEVDYSGLSLIPHSFIPHFNSNHHESEAINQVVEYCRGEGIPFQAFRDGEVLIRTTENAQQGAAGDADKLRP